MEDPVFVTGQEPLEQHLHEALDIGRTYYGCSVPDEALQITVQILIHLRASDVC